MSEAIASAYDERAAEYAALFCGDLDHNPNARQRLEQFAALAEPFDGAVADVGCGPGHVVYLLTQLGLHVIGSDISAGQVDQARTAFADLEFRVGDLTAIDSPDATLSGISSRYSIIHLDPGRLADVFAEWRRVLQPGAPLLVSFFAALSTEGHGVPFDHAVIAAHALFPATIERQLQEAGFVLVETEVLPPPEGGRPLNHATILARRQNADRDVQPR